MLIQSLKRWLSHPLTQGADIDTPETTALRREIINSKPFLMRIYNEWYSLISQTLGSVDGTTPVLELGSGAGYLDNFVPNLITSEIFYLENIKIVLDAQRLPYTDHSLKGIAMTNVLHHIPDATLFFSEAQRCVAPGGKIVLIEPWLTPWSRFIYSTLHHEPIDDQTSSWKIDGEGPLSRANSAMPWILFHRDRSKFEETFSDLKIERVEPYMPLRYLVSGGISLRSLMPSWTFTLWRWLEILLQPFKHQLGMFVIVVITKQNP